MRSLSSKLGYFSLCSAVFFLGCSGDSGTSTGDLGSGDSGTLTDASADVHADAKDSAADVAKEGAAGSTADASDSALEASSDGASSGCKSNTDCANSAKGPYCDTKSGECILCDDNNSQMACQGGLSCCNRQCINTLTDPLHCGSCTKTCSLANADAQCAAGQCSLTQCKDGFVDCDKSQDNGCEVAGTSSACTCTPGATEACYTGPAGTENIGVCVAGTHTCDPAGTGWGACQGQVLPSADVCTNDVDDDCNGVVNDGYPNADGCGCMPKSTQSCYTGPQATLNVGTCKAGVATCVDSGVGYDICQNEVTPAFEVCANGLDDDCNGQVDDSVDADGDGWTVCQGDCCDQVGSVCGSPSLVNPGAVEVPGDGVDNNCNGKIDEDPVVSCSSAAKFTGTTAWDLLNAMEICQTAANGSWGVVGTPAITRADGSGAGTINNDQIGVMAQFGTDSSNLPRFGGSFAALSSGRARDANDPDPTTTLTYTYAKGSPPADFIAPHGNALPSTGSGCPNGSGANDSAVLDVQLKVPTNANSFSFQFRFFSQEYWNYTCSNYNDFFVALLTSAWTPGAGQTAIPADKNISFDSNGSYISVNSKQFFTVCPTKSGYTCPNGTAGLVGTGYTLGPGGGTTWLTTTSPVKPGETIRLRFAIWDTSDQALDSIVLLDNFRWSATASSGPKTE